MNESVWKFYDLGSGFERMGRRWDPLRQRQGDELARYYEVLRLGALGSHRSTAGSRRKESLYLGEHPNQDRQCRTSHHGHH